MTGERERKDERDQNKKKQRDSTKTKRYIDPKLRIGKQSRLPIS